MGIFDPRKTFKPFEYPQTRDFIDALQASYWVHGEFSFVSDIHNFKNDLSDHEKEVVKRTLLAIGQIEISVKTFWAKLYDHFPKPEFNALGVQLAFNELVHEQAYTEILDILGLNTEFETILQVPEIQGRVDYLTKYIKGSADNKKEAYTLNLALFAAFVENVSLFSQFFIMKSFNKHKNYFNGVDNVISATMIEEDLHAKVGTWLISLIKEEYPEWFTLEFESKIIRACKKAYEAEIKIVQWILNHQDLPFLTFETIDNFLKDRFNQSLKMMGITTPLFVVDPEHKERYQWFNDEIGSDRHSDFFAKRPVNYARNLSSVNADDLF